MSVEFLESILLSDTPSASVKENEDRLFSIVPELRRCKGFNQNNSWHIYDVYEHILKVVDLVANDKVLRFAALFHDVGKPDVYYEDEKGVGHFFGHWEKSCKIFRAFSERYKLDTEFASFVSDLIFYHDINFDKLTNEESEQILAKFGAEKIKRLFEFKRADLLAQNPEYHYLLANLEIQENAALERLKALTE